MNVKSWMVPLLMLGALPAIAEDVSPQNRAMFESLVEKLAPGAQLDHVMRDEETGMYLLVSNTGGTVYTTPDGKTLFLGSLGTVTEEGVINRTKQTLTKRAITQPPLYMVSYKAKGEEIGAVTIFFDIDCHYCQFMHTSVDILNDYGVTVNYLPYPRGGIQTPSAEAMRGIWCHENGKELLEAYLGKRIGYEELVENSRNPNLCGGKDVVANGYYLGRSLDIKGTPAVMFEDMDLYGYYMKASDIYKKVQEIGELHK